MESSTLCASVEVHLKTWMDEFSEGLLLLNTEMNILWVNAAAEKLISAHPELGIRDSRLFIGGHQERQKLLSILETLQNGRNEITLLFAETRASSVLADISRQDPAPSISKIQPIFRLRLRWLRRRAKVNLQALGAIYSLTPEEQATVGHLIDGLPVAEIARRTERAESTVRWHVKRAYSKIGVTSREQLFTECSAFFSQR